MDAATGRPVIPTRSDSTHAPPGAWHRCGGRSRSALAGRPRRSPAQRPRGPRTSASARGGCVATSGGVEAASGAVPGPEAPRRRRVRRSELTGVPRCTEASSRSSSAWTYLWLPPVTVRQRLRRRPSIEWFLEELDPIKKRGIRVLPAEPSTREQTSSERGNATGTTQVTLVDGPVEGLPSVSAVPAVRRKRRISRSTAAGAPRPLARPLEAAAAGHRERHLRRLGLDAELAKSRVSCGSSPRCGR